MSDAFVVILCGLVVWKYGKNAKKCENCPALAVKNEKNGGFLRVCGCFCAKKGVFCEKNAPKWGGCLLRLSFTGKVYEFGALCQILVYF